LGATKLDEKANQFQVPEIKSKPEISNSDVVRSYIGLLSQGKSAL